VTPEQDQEFKRRAVERAWATHARAMKPEPRDEITTIGTLDDGDTCLTVVRQAGAYFAIPHNDAGMAKLRELFAAKPVEAV
jgi:hypothetical protein